MVRRLSVPIVCALVLAFAVALPAQAVSGDASVTVIHGLPNFTADVYVNGELLLDGFRPTEIAGPLTLAPGRYDVAIRNVGDPADAQPVLADTLNVTANAVAAVVAHADAQGDPTLSVFSNDLSGVRAGRAALVIRSVAEVPLLDVEIDGKTVAADVAPGDEERVELAPGEYRLEVISSGGEALRGPVPLEEGSARIVYVIGSADEDTLDLMVQTIDDISSPPSDVLSGTGGLVDPPAGSIRWPVLVFVLVAAAGMCTLPLVRRRV